MDIGYGKIVWPNPHCPLLPVKNTVLGALASNVKPLTMIVFSSLT